MKNGWTGGQYSLLRALLGAALLIRFAIGGGPLWERAVIAAAAVPLLGGFQDRVAAIVIIAVLIIARGPWWAIPILLFHVLQKGAPYGSVDGWGRVDPRGGWSIRPRFLDALVVPGVGGDADTVLYDGTCGVCHRAVRFLISEDAAGVRFRFAPLEIDPLRPPDSMVVKTAGGALLTRSDAVAHLARRLGGFWRILGGAGSVVPRRVRDAVYDLIARNRYRLAARPKEACPLLPPDLRARFSL
jgi:predicted DCC family thiol-disulfide oxidoreductase YuxK